MNARNLNHLNHYAQDMDEVPFSHACDVTQHKMKIPENDHKKSKEKHIKMQKPKLYNLSLMRIANFHQLRTHCKR